MNKNKYLDPYNNNNNNSYYINIYIYMESFYILFYIYYYIYIYIYTFIKRKVAGNRNVLDIIDFYSVIVTQKLVSWKNIGECHGE